MEILLLQQRIETLEKAYYGPECDEQVRRARDDVEIRHKLYSAVWKWVPPDYYHWDLAERAKCLDAQTIQHLCKCLLMENRKQSGSFVLVVLQYAATLDVKALAVALKVTNYDFRIADAADNDRITGYQHNSVTPFGLLNTTMSVPIVLAAPIVPLRFFWMGGGHVNLKLGMAVSDFCKALNPIVADISQPKSGSIKAIEGDLG
jgi:prolyl-tRNA editing enzyme YbaK/EbsC (Cys-tRNA(Pro) deacylase)